MFIRCLLYSRPCVQSCACTVSLNHGNFPPRKLSLVMDFTDKKNGVQKRKVMYSRSQSRDGMEAMQSDYRAPAFSHHARLSQMPSKEVLWQWQKTRNLDACLLSQMSASLTVAGISTSRVLLKYRSPSSRAKTWFRTYRGDQASLAPSLHDSNAHPSLRTTIPINTFHHLGVCTKTLTT